MNRTLLSVMTSLLLFMSGSFSAFSAETAATLPFSSPLDTQEDFDRWHVYNLDEGTTSWELGSSDNGGQGAKSKSSIGQATDDWLVSPAISLPKGEKYEISFKVYATYYSTEHLNVTIGTAPEPASQTTVLQAVEIKGGYDAYYYGIKVSVIIPAKDADGVYYIGINHKEKTNEGNMALVKDFKVAKVSNGNLAGTVTDSAKQPISGAAVTLAGSQTYTATTSADGAFAFNDVLQGDYNLTVSALGKTTLKKDVTVKADATETVELSMSDMATTVITGKVVDNARNPIAGARISVKGYYPYSGVTDATGTYRIEKVFYDYSETKYSMTVEKNNFETKEVKNLYLMSYEYPQSDIRLTYKNVAPDGVSVKEDADGNAAVAWKAPADVVEFAYDNGTAGSPMGFDSGRENNAIGVVYRTPATVRAVKWYTLSYTDKKPFVHVYLIDLDEQGNPNGKLLYSQLNVPTKDDEWTTFTLPEAVEAPRGFLLALSGEGNIALAKDNNNQVVGGHTQTYSNAYTAADSYEYFEDRNWPGALMLRADAVAIEKSPSALAVNYDVWRLKAADKEDESKWTQVASATTDLSKVDNTADLERGTYLYAVAANYTVDNLKSDKVFSNEFYKNQFTAVSVNVTTNAEAKDAEGATVRLDGKNSDGEAKSYKANVKNGKVSFDKVWKGNFTLTVSQNGFETAKQEVVVGDEASYAFSAELKQQLLPASTLDVVTDGDGWKMEWNVFANVSDDFEGAAYTDFEINPAGTVGWSYVDGDDKATYGFGGTTFPGMGSKMAAVLMNGNKTVPVLTKKWATSGEHSLAFFAPRYVQTEGGIERPLGDDYFISPKLDFHKDFTFAFQARSYENTEEDGAEHIRVGYSTTDNAPESFTWLTDGFEDVGYEDFSAFSYNIPKEARYVALNSSSRAFLLLVDDVTIGTDAAQSGVAANNASFLGYNVYLDGKKLASNYAGTEYALADVAEGTHTAAVTKVYKTGESEQLTKTFDVRNAGVEGTEAAVVTVYATADRKLHVEGDYNALQVVSATGVAVLNVADGRSVVDLSSLPSGVYVALVKVAGNRTVAHKFAVK